MAMKMTMMKTLKLILLFVASNFVIRSSSAQTVPPEKPPIKIVNVESSEVGPTETRLHFPLLLNNGKGFRIKCLSQNDEESVIRGLGFLGLPSVVMDPLSPEITNAHPEEQPFLCPNSNTYKIKLYRHDSGTGEQFYMQFPRSLTDRGPGDHLYISGCPQLLAGLRLDSSLAIRADPTPFFEDRIFRIDCLKIQNEPDIFSKVKTIPIPDQPDSCNSVNFSPDSTKIVSGTSGGKVYIWDVQSGKLVRTFPRHQHMVNSVSYSPDGRKILSASYDTYTKVWDAINGAELFSLSAFPGAGVKSASFNSDGTGVITGDDKGRVRFYPKFEGPNPGELAELDVTMEGHTEVVMAVNASPDGRYFVSGSWDKTIRIWKVKRPFTGSSHTFFGHSFAVTSVTFSADSSKILSGSLDSTIKIWDASTGVQLKSISDVGSGGIEAVRWSPDGSKIVSGHGNLTDNVKVWETASGKLLKTLSSHTRGVTSVNFSPDGNKIASCSHDGTVKIWGN